MTDRSSRIVSPRADADGSLAARVLCVDDEPRSLSTVARVLGRRARVTTCRSADLAVPLLGSKGPFAVVIADLLLPGMNGLEFLQEVARTSPTTTRLLMTGVNLEEEALPPGLAFRLLAKPCATERLLEVVADAVERHRLTANPPDGSATDAKRDALAASADSSVRDTVRPPSGPSRVRA